MLVVFIQSELVFRYTETMQKSNLRNKTQTIEILKLIIYIRPNITIYIKQLFKSTTRAIISRSEIEFPSNLTEIPRTVVQHTAGETLTLKYIDLSTVVVK